MAMLLLLGSLPGLRIGSETAAKGHDAYLGPVPGDTTPILCAAEVFLRLFFDDIFGLLYRFDLGKKSLGA